MNTAGYKAEIMADCITDEYMPLRKDFDRAAERYAENGEMEDSFGRRISLFVKDFPLKTSFRSISGLNTRPLGSFYITTDQPQYEVWWHFMVLVCAFSSMFTPLEFGFFRGLPRELWIVDLLVQVIFVLDIILRFFTAYTHPDTYRLVTDYGSIAWRYIKGDFFLELLACLSWDTIYKVTGHKEEIRYLVWLRLYRVVKLHSFFNRIEKDIRINYFAARIIKLLVVEIYCVHTAACMYYYLATTVDPADEAYTWIGSLEEGNFSYQDFRDVDLGKRYAIALYWAVVTMTTVGYGDVHGVNVREMIFIIIYESFNMILAAYILGNMTALIVKGSATEKFRDKMASLMQFMTKHQLPHSVMKEMKSHLVLQFNSGSHEELAVLAELPSTIRSKVAHSLYTHIIERVRIFKGCSPEFLDEIVSRVVEEHFLPGELVIQQGGASDQFYIVCHGVLEEVLVHEDGKVELIEEHREESVFGEVGVLCGIPQPFSVRVSELCRLLRLDKPSFTDLVQIFFNDGRLLINNLLEWKDADARIGQIAADITYMVAKHNAEMTLMVNNASFQGDLAQLKHLVKQGAIVARADYDGRTALHLAASRGFEAVVLYLVREGADVNAIDKFGITPLLEAVKAGHDPCIDVLIDQGALLHLHDSGTYLCQAVMDRNTELLNRLLHVGADPSSADYDDRTPLHIAAAEGNVALATTLIESGADILARDRWDRTALQEAESRNHTSLIPLLTEAMQRRASRNTHGHTRNLRRSSRIRSSHHRGESESSTIGQTRDAETRDSTHSGDSSSGSSKKGHGPKKGHGHGFVHGHGLGHGNGHGQGPWHIQHHRHLVRQTSHESRMGLGTSISRAGSGSVGLDNVAHQYRVLPLRRRGRQTSLEHSSAAAAGWTSRRRLTHFPFHPFAPANMRTSGRADWVPPNVQAILLLSREHFGKEGSKLLNQDAGEILNTDLIMDLEKVFVVDDEDIRLYSGLIRSHM